MYENMVVLAGYFGAFGTLLTSIRYDNTIFYLIIDLQFALKASCGFDIARRL